MLRREMAKIPAVINALDSVERSVFVASTDRLIEEYTGVELAQELARALTWIAKDIGFRSNDESERQYLVIRTSEILKRYYSQFSLKDFRLAFEMSLTGELDDYLPKGRDGQPDRGHYQQFNAEYICKILNAYKARRAGVLNKAYEAMPKKETAQTNTESRYYDNQIKKDCINAFLFFKYHGTMPDLSLIGWILCYNTLARVGLVDEIEITPEEQRIVFKSAVNELLQRGDIGHANILKKEGMQAKELRHGGEVLARRRLLRQAFEWIVSNELQITDYIKIA